MRLLTQQQGGLVNLRTEEGLATAIAMANATLDARGRSEELTQSIDIPWIPPTLNELLEAGKGKAGKWRLNKIKRDWTTKLSGFFSLIGVKAYDRGDPVWIEFVWWINFHRDFDNLHTANKFILDALRDAKIISNDNLATFQSPVAHWHEKPGLKADHVVMTLSNLPCHNVKRYKAYIGAIADSLDRW